MRCVHFSNGEISGVLSMSSDPGQWLIRDGAHEWRFNWSARWGALRVRKNGGTAEQPSHRSSFWRITAIWARQGKRTEPCGRELLAVWEEPPPVTTYVRRIGKRSFIEVRTEQPLGYDPLYSAEITVEVP